MPKNVIFTALGIILLVVGAVGVAVPVMPTTPFVIVAAFCFSIGNKKLAAWLERNRIFGPYIENYRAGTGIDLRLKISSIVFVWVGLTISMFIVQTLWVTLLLIAVGIAVTIHLLMIKTKR